MRSFNNDYLSHVVRNLMLRGSFLDNIGLLNGKMGIVIFFYHYAEYTGRKVYADFADELIDEIYQELHSHYDIGFESGLCGIAWGMEYIIQHHFVEADSNIVLKDIDKKILEWDVRRICDYSLENGLLGVAHYIISRCSCKTIENRIIPADYIAELHKSLSKADHPNILILNSLEIILNKHHNLTIDNTWLYELLTKTKKRTIKSFSNSTLLGISKDGLAGIGLKLILISNE